MSAAALTAISARAEAASYQRRGLAPPTPGTAPVPQKAPAALARIGATVITMPQAITVADTPALQLLLCDAVNAFAAKFHVAHTPNETDEAFFDRLCNEALVNDQLGELEDSLADCVDRACLQSALALVDNASLRRGLTGQDLSDIDPQLPVVDQNALLRDRMQVLLATQAKVPPNSPQASQLIEQWSEKELEQALWSPYQGTFDSTFAQFPPADRATLRDAFFNMYFDTYGIDTPREFAAQLHSRGAASTLAKLVNATGRLSWTATDLSEAALKDPDLAKWVKSTLHGVGIDDTLLYGGTPLAVKVDMHGLHVSAPHRQKSKLLGAMQDGKAHVLWTTDPELALSIIADDKAAFSKDDIDSAHDAILTRLLLVPDALKRAWAEGKPAFGKVMDATGLGPYAKDGLKDLVLTMPGVRGALESMVTSDIMLGKSAADIAATCAKLELPKVESDKLVALAKNTEIMRATYTPPRAVKDLLTPGSQKSIDIPLTVGAKLNDEQTQAVAMMQTYFLGCGLLPLSAQRSPPEHMGELDAATVQRLSELAPEENAKVFTLNAKVAPQLFAQTARGVRAPALIVGDWASQNAALIAHRHHGGTMDPMRLTLAYLDAQGFDVITRPPRVSQALYDAIAATSGMPLDSAALARAEAKAATLPEPSESELADFMTAKFALVATHPPHAVALEPASAAERKDLLRRITARTTVAAERSVARGDFGMLALNEPIVALKLAVADLAEQRAPVTADGSIDGVMPGPTLRTLRNILFPKIRSAAGSEAMPADAPELYKQFSRVADAIERGELTIANLSEDIPASAAIGKDGNAVLATLRDMAQGLRAGTLPTTAAQAAVQQQMAQFDPVYRKPQPLAAAQVILGGLAASGPARMSEADIARVEAKVAEARTLMTSPIPEVAAAATTFIGRWDALAPQLPTLRQALTAGSLRIVEQSVTCESSALALKGQELLDAVIAAAEIKQTQGRIANRGALGSATRGAISAYHHLGVLPGFGDDFAYNTADGWMLAALKLEMAQNGGPDISQNPKVPTYLRTVDGKLVATPPEAAPAAGTQTPEALAAAATLKAETDKARALGASVMSVNADALRYVIDRHGEMLGRSKAEMLAAGIPEELPSTSESKALLEKIISKMKSGEMQPWDNLDITVADTDPEVRKAKAVLQSALSRMQQAPALMHDRDGVTIGATATRLLGVEKNQTQMMLRAFVVRQGYMSASEVGALNDTALSPALIDKTVAVALMYADRFSPTAAASIRAAAETLYKSAQSGLTITNGANPSDAEKALRLIVRYATSELESNRMQMDPGSVIPSSATKLKITGPLHNGVTTVVPSTFTDATKRLGQQTSWSDEQQTAFATWEKRVRFDPEKAFDTTLSSWMLFHYAMPTLIAYDLSVAPAHKIYDGAREYLRADSDDERQAAKDRMWRAVTGVSDNLAMFTAFYSPVGFAQDIKHEVQEGRLDVAAGKLLVTGGMMWGSGKMLYHGGKSVVGAVRDRIWYKNKPYEVLDTRLIRVEQRSVTPGGARLLRRGVGEVAQVAGTIKDVALHPTEILGAGKELGMRGVRTLRELAHKQFNIGGLKVKPLKNSDAFELTLSKKQLDWMREDLHLGGYGRLEIDVAQLRPKANGKVHAAHEQTISLTTSQLRDLAQTVDVGGGSLSPQQAKDMGFADGAEASRFVQSLQPVAAQLRDLPIVPKDAPRLPTLSELSKSAADTVDWFVEINGARHSVKVRNSTLVKLVNQYYTGEVAAFDRTLRLENEQALKADPKATPIDPQAATALVQQYRNQSFAELKRADRRAYGSDLGSRAQQTLREPGMQLHDLALRLQGKAKRAQVAIKSTLAPDIALGARAWTNAETVNGTRLLFKWEDDAVQFRILETKDGKIKVRAGSQDITTTDVGKKLLDKLTSDRRNFGTLDPAKIETIKRMEVAHANWASQAESGLPLTPERKAALEGFETEARAALADLEGDAAATLRGRLKIDMIKLKFARTSFQAALEEGGIKGATVKVLESGWKGMKGALKEPSFYLIVVVSGREFLVDLGHTINDDSLSAMDKIKTTLVSAAVRGGEAAVGFAMFAIAKRLAPRLVKGVEGPMLILTILDLPNLVDDVASSFAGYKGPIESLRYFQQAGIPEATYFRLSGDNPMIGQDISNDLGSLDRNQADLVTPRTTYWYFNGGSSLHNRLRQLCGYDVNDGNQSPIRKPQDLMANIGKVRHFHEPVWEATETLAHLATIAQDTKNAYNAVPDAASFDYATWNTGVQGKAAGALQQLEAGEGMGFVQMNESGLRELLRGEDAYDDNLTQVQKDALAHRISQEIIQTTHWLELLNSLQIPGSEKLAAMKQLLVNMAAQHRVTALNWKARAAFKEIHERNGDHYSLGDDATSIEDSYATRVY